MKNLIKNRLFWIETYQYTRNIYIFWPRKYINQLIIWIPNSCQFAWVRLTILWEWRLNGYFKFSTLPYEPSKGSKTNLPETRTCCYRTNSVLFLGTLLWNNFPRNVKESHSVAQFKEKIKELGNLTSCVVCR